MALPNCVKVVLCGLSASVRNALVALVQGYILQLEVYKAALEAQLVYLNILTAPPQLAYNVVQGVITEAKAGANLIPLDLIGSCVDIGNLNQAIQANLDIILADAQIIANDLSRLLSFKDEVQAAIDEVQAVIDFYVEIISITDACEALGVTTT